MASEMAALSSALGRWEFAGYISLFTVAVGCAGEAIHEFTGWLTWSRWWVARGGKASAMLLIAALAAELITQVKTNSLSGQIIANLNDETAQANLELERIKAPRNLDAEAQKRIADKIRPFGSFPFEIQAGPIEPGSAIDAQLIGLLTDAGWSFLPAPDWVMKSRDPRVAFALSDTFGVWVDFHTTATGKIPDAAQALADALMTEKLDAHSRSVTDPRMDATRIRILVSPKP